MISEFRADVPSIVSRTKHIEKKMAEFAKSLNALIDSYVALEEEVARLSTKVLDLEDRSRHNNIRIRGIPKSAQAESLRSFLTDLMALAFSSTQLDINYRLDTETKERVASHPKGNHSAHPLLSYKRGLPLCISK